MYRLMRYTHQTETFYWLGPCSRHHFFFLGGHYLIRGQLMRYQSVVFFDFFSYFSD